jgi:RNA polymerase sigma-70 factor (ECF subfamily)
MPLPVISPDSTDAGLTDRIREGDENAFERLMRRFNQRLFRVARAILKDDAAAEDAVQETYLQAFRGIREFRGESQLATWLTRIVVNQSLMRVRSDRRQSVVVPFAADGTRVEAEVDVVDERAEPAPERLYRGEIRRLLEEKIDGLPASFRTVFVLREVQELSVEETAECLSIPAATVRTRLFRAKALLRAALDRDVEQGLLGVFAFDGVRCDSIVSRTLRALRDLRDLQAPGNAEP